MMSDRPGPTWRDLHGDISREEYARMLDEMCELRPGTIAGGIDRNGLPWWRKQKDANG
jgi:hypothetical protein